MSDDSDDFKFFGLGGCNEVGRSCHVIQYKNKTIMLDAGVHPGLNGLSSLPFYDEFDLSKVDILLISHFHLDHAASLPYVMQHTNFKGRVFMTHATKAIYRWLLSDFVRVTSIGSGGDSRGGGGPTSGGDGKDDKDDSSSNLYTDVDLMRSFDRIETIDYHSTIEIDGIRFTAYHAGHVLGACMYFIEIGGLKILFTGDYSREEDRHLHVAEVPPQKPDILICESTFGTATHEPRLEKEARMTNIIHSTLAKGGRILMPVFALGRAQELLLILEEYWSQNEDLRGINIYYASSLARKCMAVYQTYTNIMNDNIRLNSNPSSSSTSSSSGKSNPFQFKYIKSIKSLDKFQDFGPCVVVASPGMLQSGVSRELLEKWAPDPKNAVIMTGYSVEGTMAKELLTEPHTIQSITNSEKTIPRRLNIEEISFAAHVDFEQNAGFIDEVNPLKIILVHGESNPMGRLKSALLSKYSSRKGTEQEVKVFNPRNCDELRLKIKGLRIAKVLGSLGEEQLSMLKREIDRRVEEQNVKVEEIKEEEIEEEKEDKDVDMEGAEQVKKEEEEEVNGESVITAEQPVSGLLVSKDFDLNLLQLQDLHEYTQLSTSIVKSKINLKINANIDLIKWHLEQMFGYIEVINDDEDEWEVLIMDQISVIVDHNATIKYSGGIGEGSRGLIISVEWINDNLMADSLADSIVAILYSVDSSPASVKLSSKKCSHSHQVKVENDDDGTIKDDSNGASGKSAHANSAISLRIHRISTLLRAQFGDTFTTVEGKENEQAVIKIGKTEARIDYLNLSVECGSKVLRDRVENVIKRGCGLAAPLSQYQKAA